MGTIYPMSAILQWGDKYDGQGSGVEALMTSVLFWFKMKKNFEVEISMIVPRSCQIQDWAPNSDFLWYLSFYIINPHV